METPINDKIKAFFRAKPDVVAVYLFGSLAKDKGTSFSDVDIAVYYRPRQVPNFRTQLNEQEDLAGLLGREVDLVILNKADPILKRQIFEKGIPLLNQDPKALGEFYIYSFTEYDDLKRIRAPLEKNILKREIHG